MSSQIEKFTTSLPKPVSVLIYCFCFTTALIGSIEESESLFVYGASGSWSDYNRPNHEPVFADELTFTPEQQAVCGDSLQCLYDLSQTGSEEIAMDTLLTDETNQQDQLISRMLLEFRE